MGALLAMDASFSQRTSSYLPFLFSNPFVQMNVFLVGSDSRTGALYGERGSRTALGRNDNALNDAV